VREAMTGNAEGQSSIDRAIDRFVECQARHGQPPPGDPISDEDLATVADAISPLRFPDELLAVWARFQGEKGGLAAGYRLLPAKYGLEAWQMGKERLIWPLCLFPIAYESHHFVWIELQDDFDLGGGAIWKGCYGYLDVTQIAPTLADLINAIVDSWDAGIIFPSSPGSEGLIQDDDRWLRLTSQRFGPPRAIDISKRYIWPRRWKRLSGLEDGVPFPPGAITRIGDLASSPDWQAGRPVVVEGEVRTLMAGPGSRCVVDDGTGTLEVWVPADLPEFADSDHPGPTQVELVRSSGAARESDIRSLQVDLTGLVRGGSLEAAQEAVTEFMAGFDMTEAEATAVSVRWSGKSE